MIGNEATGKATWFDALLQKLHLDKLNVSTNRLVEIGIALGAGFLVGFLLKRCASYVFVVILALVALFVLHQFEIITITINPGKMQELFGIQQSVTLDTNLFMVYWEWIKLNMALVLSFSIGLLIGLKIG